MSSIPSAFGIQDSSIPYQHIDSNGFSGDISDWNAENGYIVASHERLDSSNSIVRVEICDLDERTHTTTGVLRLCQQVILKPYSKLLSFVGWRAIGRDSVNNGCWPLRFLNLLYATIIISIQLYTFIYQVIACEGKLIINQDTHDPTTTPSSPNSTDDFWLPIGPSAKRRQCYHITTTYIVPALLHFTVYVMGFIHFRVQENENLYALMEKVFLRHAPLNRGIAQSGVIYGARGFLYGGLLWSALAVSLQGLSAAAFGVTPTIWFIELQETWWTELLFGIQLAGFLVVYLVQVAVVVNYATQCELLIAYIKGIAVRLREKSTDLRVAMHDILEVREGISMLNGTVSRMTAIGVLCFTEMTIMGLCLLVLNDSVNPWTWIYRVMYPVIYGAAMLFPLIQAARVAKNGDKLKQICFGIRVFGYKEANQLELDSFVLFVTQATLRTKLFSIPVQPGLIMSFISCVSLALLILFQMGVIAGANILF